MDKSYIIEEINITRPIGWTTEEESDMLVKNGFDKETADMVFYGVKIGGVVADFKLPIPKTTQTKTESLAGRKVFCCIFFQTL